MSSCNTELNTLLVQIGPTIGNFFKTNLICSANIVFAITFVVVAIFMLFSLILGFLPSFIKWIIVFAVILLGVGSIWNLYFRTP